VTELAARIVRPPRLGLVLVAATALGLLAAGYVGFRMLEFRGEARPGVHVFGVDVAGSRPAAVALAVRRAGAAELARPLRVDANGHAVVVRAGEALRLDVPQTTRAAMAAGSFVPFSTSDVQPVFRVKPAGLVAVVARIQRHGRPPVSASVRMRGTTPVVVPAHAGLSLDRKAFLASLERFQPVATFHAETPRILDPAARRAALVAKGMVVVPVRLTFKGRAVGTLSRERLVSLLRFVPRRDRYAVTFRRAALADAVRPALGPWRSRATNARFEASGETARVIPSRPGFDVDPREAVGAVLAATHGNRIAPLALAAVPADFTTGEANALGIRRRVSSFTTELGASSSNRIHNVHLMADFIDGTIVKPRVTFSFNGVVGPRTSERGFLEGQMIVGSLVLPAIGGGVCQTATTLFNNAFDLGLPIVERHNHNLYLSHYPLGRDATVSWGGPDLKFRNDMKSGLLIKSSYTDSTLTFTFYGTPEGRRVTAVTGPKVNWRPAKLTYAVDPSAPAGSVSVVGGSGASGFDVSVYRTVYRGDRVLRKDTFTSSYVPEGPTSVYGPGRTPPGSYIVIPPH